MNTSNTHSSSPTKTPHLISDTHKLSEFWKQTASKLRHFQYLLCSTVRFNADRARHWALFTVSSIIIQNVSLPKFLILMYSLSPGRTPCPNHLNFLFKYANHNTKRGVQSRKLSRMS